MSQVGSHRFALRHLHSAHPHEPICQLTAILRTNGGHPQWGRWTGSTSGVANILLWSCPDQHRWIAEADRSSQQVKHPTCPYKAVTFCQPWEESLRQRAPQIGSPHIRIAYDLHLTIWICTLIVGRTFSTDVIALAFITYRLAAFQRPSSPIMCSTGTV